MIPMAEKWRISAEKKHSFSVPVVFSLPSMGGGVVGGRLTNGGERIIMGVKE